MDAIVEYDGKKVKFCDLNPEDYIGSILLKGGWYELLNLEFIRSLNIKGNYVDVGAYIGTHSIFFSLYCPSDNVYSFEANNGTFDKLVKNLKINGIIKCQTFNLAISDKPGCGSISDGYEDNSGGSLFMSGHGPVECITLDMMGLTDIKLMKIDVEGMELSVLQGAVETLKSVDHLFIELWHKDTCIQRNSEYLFPAVVEFLEDQCLYLQRVLYVDNLYYFNRVKL